MFTAWRRLSREQRRVWGLVAGAITVGTVFKVAYFNFSRKLIVGDSKRQEQKGIEHLREAREFAAWSKKDRESRLPQLTEEQREQMRQYLLIVERHGMSKAFAAHAQGGGSEGDKDCPGCPVLNQARRVASTLAQSPSK